MSRLLLAGVGVVLVAFTVNCNGLANHQSPLHDAARAGNLEEVKRILAEGCDVNIKDDRQENALWEAVMGKHFEIADFLVRKGIRTGEPNYSGDTLEAFCTEREWSECLNWFKSRKLSEDKPFPGTR